MALYSSTSLTSLNKVHNIIGIPYKEFYLIEIICGLLSMQNPSYFAIISLYDYMVNILINLYFYNINVNCVTDLAQHYYILHNYLNINHIFV